MASCTSSSGVGRVARRGVVGSSARRGCCAPARAGGKGFREGSARKAGGKRRTGDDWTVLPLTLTELVEAEKPIVPLILDSGKAVVVVRWGDGDAAEVFVAPANSTAYQYPLADAELFAQEGSGEPAIRVKLDGTTYDLRTGAVLEWCPQDNPVRFMLGKLKEQVAPVPLAVYPVDVGADGTIAADFVAGLQSTTA